MSGISATGGLGASAQVSNAQSASGTAAASQGHGVTDMLSSTNPRDNVKSPVSQSYSGQAEAIDSSKLTNGRFNKVF